MTTIFVPTLLILLGLFMLLGPIFYFVDKNYSEFFVLGWGVFGILAAATIGGVAYDHYHASDTVYQLSAREWECSSTYQTAVFTGKVWITETRCSQYSMKNQ